MIHPSTNAGYTGLFDINEQAVETLAKDLGKEQAFGLKMDVTCPDSVKPDVDSFMEKTGNRLDLSQQKTTVDINLTGDSI